MIMTTQRFNSRCGGNISLSDNNSVAERVRGDLDDGIVFTEQAVELGTVFQAKILEYDDKWGGTIVSDLLLVILF